MLMVDVRVGSIGSFWQPTRHFGSTRGSGHRQAAAVSPFGAKRRSYGPSAKVTLVDVRRAV